MLWLAPATCRSKNMTACGGSGNADVVDNEGIDGIFIGAERARMKPQSNG